MQGITGGAQWPLRGDSGEECFYAVSGRAVRWGDPQVSRRGLIKGVFDSKYGQRAESFGPFRL